MARGAKPGLWLSLDVLQVSDMSCGFNGGHSAAASVVTVTLGAEAGHVPMEGRYDMKREQWSSIVCQSKCFLIGFFLSPPTLAFFFSVTSYHPVYKGFIHNCHPAWKGLLLADSYAEHSRADRNLPEGNAITFCMFSLLPIWVFLSKNANRPEIECISKCNREVKCIFSTYG